jgi:hypothetical protein
LLLPVSFNLNMCNNHEIYLEKLTEKEEKLVGVGGGGGGMGDVLLRCISKGTMGKSKS